jgi:1-deoxy-D-xylulose-5-phosphate reductoisomerase
VLAQMGNPDMRTPIAHAMAWPNRIKSSVQTLDLKEIVSLDFAAVDNDRFPAILLGQQAVETGGTAPVILNAANEIAVDAFLANTLSFTQIPVIIERALNQQECSCAESIEAVLEADAKARELTRQLVSNCQ